MKERKRFAVGASVRVRNPGVNGVVTATADVPTVMGEYWHKIHTEHGERHEPGCNLELVPVPVTNKTGQGRSNMTKQEAAESLLLPEQAIALLRKQLDVPVESYRHDDPRIDGWERVTLKIVERTFGEHTRNANHFVASVSHMHETDEEAQQAHVDHIASKKAMLRAFIDELEIIPPPRPAVDVTRQGVFFAGQTFDALSAASRIFASAKSSLTMIDGYIGAETLSLLPTQPGITIKILTRPLSPAVRTLCQAFKTQHGSLTVRSSAAFHDRFVIIDGSAVYHFGASVKDLGKKTFMFSLIEEPEIVADVLSKVAAEWNTAEPEV